MRALRSAVVVIALSAGCTDSCACGEGGEDAKPAQGATAGRGGGQQAAASPGAAGGTAPAAPKPASWQPAPDSELTRQLAAAKAQLEEEDKVVAKLATEKVLGGPLGDRLGELKAEGALSSTVRETTDAKLAVAARNYKQGDRAVRVKISDTGLLPNARRVVSNRLTMIGNEAVGNERGAFVRGYPAVVAHFAEQKVSRASAVLANRYLLQVVVRNAAEPDDALRVIEQLDWSGFAPKQGKIPSPAEPESGAAGGGARSGDARRKAAGKQPQ